MDSRVIFLRKKILGENSIEECAYRIAQKVGAVVKVCPCFSTSLQGILQNIVFAKANQGAINHIIAPSECYLLPFLKGKKIITFHDLGTLYASRNRLLKLLKVLLYIKPAEYFADSITFVSKYTFDEFTQQEWHKNRNKVVIYNSYDDRLIYDDVSRQEVKSAILHIGTGKRKNLEAVIAAVKGFDIKLLIVGRLSGDQQKMLNENNIVFENYYDIPYSEIVHLYNRASIVSFPTFYEGFGLPVIEAQVMHKPVFASKIPIIEEVGRDAVCYVDPYSTASIRDAISNLLYNQRYRDSLIEKGVENAKRFSSSTILDSYASLYTNVYL